MTKLRISLDLSLPDSTATSTILVLGGKGMGKTNLDAVIAEECAANAIRYSWVDPIGVAWSLQHGATKSEPGLEVLVLGGIHGDIPIEPTGGELVADLVVDHDVSVVIDISRYPTGKLWSHGAQIRFVTDYMTHLYERQGERRRRILQIFDEIGRFAPQTIRSGDMDIAKCLGAIEQIVELGRNVGIGMLMSTQRNARVAASIRELADALFAFRTVGPLSLKAVIDWLGEHVEKGRINPIVEQIRSLPVGHAMLISPGWLQLEKVVAVRKRSTFDASATPTGKGSRAPGRARKPDLAKFRELMAATIEKQRADDPVELRKAIATLRKELEAERRKQPAPAPAAKPKIVYAVKQVHLERAERVIKQGREIVELLQRSGAVWDSRLRHHADGFEAFIGGLASAVALTKQSAPSAPPPTSAPAARSIAGSNGGGAVRAAAPRPPSMGPSDEGRRGAPQAVDARSPLRSTPSRSGEPRVTTEGITARQQRFLDAAATLTQLDVEVTRETVSAWLGIHPRGGSVGEELKALEVEGLINLDRGRVTVTDKGFSNANVISQEQAIENAKAGLEPRQRRIFDIIAAVYPGSITREEIARSMTSEKKPDGLHPRGGSLGEDIGRLAGRGLITIERGSARARDFLFAGVA